MRIPPEEWEGVRCVLILDCLLSYLTLLCSLLHELVLPIWKSEASVALMIDKKAKS